MNGLKLTNFIFKGIESIDRKISKDTIIIRKDEFNALKINCINSLK